MPSSSRWLGVGSLAVASFFASPAAAGTSSYSLKESWQGDSFFDYFDFFTASDPTNGYVTYLNQSAAESAGLLNVTDSGSIYMGVDHTTTLNPNGAGRDSVRIDSKKFYDHGLFIADIQHMPGSICGIWPAFWSVGPSWPGDGEIDILEGVNLHEYNEVVLHTSGTCTVTTDDMTGKLTSSECGEASGTVGCVVDAANGTYGTPFNKNGGGIYAMEWSSEFIKIWFFPRSSIPESITAGSPNTTAFGTPMANMQGSCDIEERFKSQKFIFDTTFCGDWAGGVFLESGCPISDSSSAFASCTDYVAKNPEAFEEAYWEINSIKVYEAGSNSTGSVSSILSSEISASITSAITAWNTHSANAPAETSVASADTSAVESTVVAATPEPSVAETSATEAVVESSSTEASAPTFATTSAIADSPAVTSTVESEAASKSTLYVTSKTTICPSAEASSSAAAAAAASAASSRAVTHPVESETPAYTTEYVISRTTECPIAEASSSAAAAAAALGGQTAITSAAAADALDNGSHSSSVSVHAPASDAVSTTVNGADIPTSVASTPSAVSEPTANPAKSPVDISSLEQLSATPVPSSNAASQVTGAAISSAAVPSDASPVGSSHHNSASLIPSLSDAVSAASTVAAIASDYSSAQGSRVAGSSSSTVFESPVFTGAADRVSAGMVGMVGAVAMIIMV